MLSPPREKRHLICRCLSSCLITELYGSNCFPIHKEQKGELWKIQKCYIVSLKASLPTVYCIIPPALLVHLHMRMNCLPHLYEAGQVLMMRLIIQLSSKLSFFISFTSATSRGLKLRHRRESVFHFSGLSYYLFENWPSKPWAPTHRWAGISLPSRTTSDVNPAPRTQLPHPPSRSQPEDTVWPSSHASLHPCSCCTDPALLLPPAPPTCKVSR